MGKKPILIAVFAVNILVLFGGGYFVVSKVTEIENAKLAVSRADSGVDDSLDDDLEQTQKVDAHSAHLWSYVDPDGPDRWSELSEDYGACSLGRRQSPIDLRAQGRGTLPPLKFNYFPGELRIVNTGRTIQINSGKGSWMQFKNEVYELREYHFHTPSEHFISGNQFPMEIHLVHESEEGEIFVIGVLIKAGTAHPMLEKIWERIPESENKEYVFESVLLNVTSLIPKESGYFSYAGSLTRPPCTENVNWLVLERPIEASEHQISTFRSYYQMNARPLQPINQRPISTSL